MSGLAGPLFLPRTLNSACLVMYNLRPYCWAVLKMCKKTVMQAPALQRPKHQILNLEMN